MADQNSQFMAILTAVGEARLANAQALGIAWNITQLSVGDGNGAEPMPDRLQTALINERRRAPLNQLSVAPNNASIIIAEQVIPEDVGGWWIREIGLYDEAGDLVAVANCPPTFKPQLAQGSGRTQVVRLNLLVSSTQSITLKIDPSVVLATRAYADALIVGHLAAADPHPQYQLRGAITSLSANTQLAAGHEGLLLLSAAAGARTFTLPAANAALGVRELVLRRSDTTANALTIAASGTNKLMLDTTAEAAGQASTELLFAGDYMRLRSDGAGNWWCVGQAQLPGSIARGFVAFTEPGVTTYSVPAVLRSGRRRARIEVVGGGGGGGRHDTIGGGGGAGGGRARGLVSLSGVTAVTITVGAGGAGKTSGENGAGNNGGSSSFGSYMSALGGGGGQGDSYPYGGSGTNGTGGTINDGGGDGSSGAGGASGKGGGPGGRGTTNTGATGRSSPCPGGGGGGSIGGAGGAGGAGYVLLEW